MKEAAQKASAVHLEQDDCHAVLIDSLRVLIITDGPGWFAQGLEIDFAAGGASIDEAKENFQHGLTESIHEHLRVYGSIERLVKAAPDEDWKLYSTNKDQFILSMATFLTKEQLAKNPGWPYSNIAFLEQQVA